MINQVVKIYKSVGEVLPVNYPMENNGIGALTNVLFEDLHENTYVSIIKTIVKAIDNES